MPDPASQPLPALSLAEILEVQGWSLPNLTATHGYDLRVKPEAEDVVIFQTVPEGVRLAELRKRPGGGFRLQVIMVDKEMRYLGTGGVDTDSLDSVRKALMTWLPAPPGDR